MKPLIPCPCLCLVTDRRLCHSQPMELEKKVAQAVAAGVNMVQLREKDLPGGQLLELAERLRRVTDGRALLFVNERVDVALACGAEGVQLGEDAVPVEAARQVVGDRLLIGRSVHSVEGAWSAEKEGADFLVVGSVFPTVSHSGNQAAGPQLLSQVAGTVRTPFVGIGGINSGNVEQVITAGASGAAVMRSILAAQDTARAARELKEAICVAWASSRPDQQGSTVASNYRPKAGQ